MSSLEPNEVLVLCAIRDGAQRAPEIRRPAAALRNAALASLESAGLVRTERQGRSLQVALTSRGERIAAELTPPLPTGRSAGGRATSEAILQQILASLADLHRAVANLDARVRTLATAPRPTQESPRPPAPAPRPEVRRDGGQSLRAAILEALQELDGRHRFGGLVPIPELRRALIPHGFGPTAVNEALEALEREFVIDLNIAQSPTQVPDSSAGILRPGRGLLYYVARRADS